MTDRIPAEGYFGVTAATGGLSDDHDVISFITHSLLPHEQRAEDQVGEGEGKGRRRGKGRGGEAVV